MNQWWVDDLPLPLPHTTYKWARDHTMLVTLFSKYLQMVGKSFEPPQCECYKKVGTNRIPPGPAEYASCHGSELLLHGGLCSGLHQAGPQHLLSRLQVLFSFPFSTVCILLITRKDRTDNPNSLFWPHI